MSAFFVFLQLVMHLWMRRKDIISSNKSNRNGGVDLEKIREAWTKK